MNLVNSLFLLLCATGVACAPKVQSVNEPLILETGTDLDAPPVETAAVNSVEIPRIRTGMIARAQFEDTLKAGVGQFLRRLDVAPQLQEGRFAGWIVQRFDNPWVDLVPGDIVRSVNGAKIETPSQVQELWLRLSESQQILVSVTRGDTDFELRFTIQGAARSEGT